MKGLPASKKSTKDLKAPCDTKTDKDSTAGTRNATNPASGWR